MITVVLADDHTGLRYGLKCLLDQDREIKIIGEASNGLQAIELTRQLQPDVLVLDIVMPVMNGFAVAEQLAGDHSPTKIIMLSMHSQEAYIHEALRCGAQAYVIKDNSADELRNAIIDVFANEKHLDSSFNERISLA
jgi:DNA-binding NarL/FixJ family response regulator